MSYQVPRGTQDILPKDISKWHRLEDLIRQFCHVYDYEEIRTPIFEHTNVFKRGNDSSDMVNKEMYTFCLENSPNADTNDHPSAIVSTSSSGSLAPITSTPNWLKMRILPFCGRS